MSWLTEFAHTNPICAAIVFVFIRSLAIIVPPIPGAFFDLPAVQIFGWKLAFVLSEIGTMLGAMCAFGLARWSRQTKFGYVAGHFFRIDKVQEWERVLPAKDQFLAWVALRLPTNAAFDYISYAAGLTNCNGWMFFWSTLIGNIPIVFIFFALAGAGLHYGHLLNWILPIAFLCLFSIPVIFRLWRKVRTLLKN